MPLGSNLTYPIATDPSGMSTSVPTQTEKGKIYAEGPDFIAKLQVRGPDGSNVNITGPSRKEKSAAESDLDGFRKACALFPDDRERAIQALRAEQLRLRACARKAHEEEAQRFEGSLEQLGEAFRAHIQYRDGGKKQAHIRGPKKHDKVAAANDLDSLRAAAAAYPKDRARAIVAMEVQAQRLKQSAQEAREDVAREAKAQAGMKKTPLSDKGRVATENTGYGAVDYRAIVDHTTADGQRAILRGPYRMNKFEAQKDLDDMRSAAAVFPNDQAMAFQAMHAQVRRIKEHMRYLMDEATKTRCQRCDEEVEFDEECIEVGEPDEWWWHDLQDGKMKFQAKVWMVVVLCAAPTLHTSLCFAVPRSGNLEEQFCKQDSRNAAG